MSIPAEKLDEARRSLEDRILEFLRRNRGTAFTATEIMQAVEYPDGPSMGVRLAIMADDEREKVIAKFSGTLNLLIGKTFARMGEYHGQTYFTAC